jgi:succinoglycan biosynthesis protein ExoL
MKILYLLPVLGQPRFIKRMRGLEDMGASNEVAFFSREYFEGAGLEYPSHNLGEIMRGKYLKRGFIYLESIWSLRKLAMDNEVIYCFGLDMAILGFVSTIGTGTKVVLEVGDLRPLQFSKSFLGSLARALDRVIYPFLAQLVVTSEAFYESYYSDTLHLDSKKVSVIENKLFASDVMTEDFSIKYRVGYFGLIRCKRSLEILAAFANARRNNFNLYVRGYPFDVQQELDSLLSNPGVLLGDEYKSPEDLGSLYGRVDLVWACYPFSSETVGNWRLAKTNRFYESMAYGIPIIVQSGTMDAIYVKKFGLGLVLDMADIECSILKLLSIKDSDVSLWKLNIENLEDSIFLYSNEHEKLFEALMSNDNE